jgi:hypothetical protein
MFIPLNSLSLSLSKTLPNSWQANLNRLSNAAIYWGDWVGVWKGFSVKTNYISKVLVEFSIGIPRAQYKCC